MLVELVTIPVAFPVPLLRPDRITFSAVLADADSAPIEHWAPSAVFRQPRPETKEMPDESLK